MGFTSSPSLARKSAGRPSDIFGGTRPSFVGFQLFIGEQSASLGERTYCASATASTIPGQSGSPYFGFWPNEPWPRVVGIQSGENLGRGGGDNTCGGGNPLSELINIARSDHP